MFDALVRLCRRIALRLWGPWRDWCGLCVAGAHKFGYRHYVCHGCRDIFCWKEQACVDVGGHDGPCLYTQAEVRERFTNG